MSRLIDFAGFNVPLESRYRDVGFLSNIDKIVFFFSDLNISLKKDWRDLNFPPMQDCHLKKVMKEKLKKQMRKSKKRLRSPESDNKRKEIAPPVIVSFYLYKKKTVVSQSLIMMLLFHRKL